jgi:hypothetical protein
VFPQHLVERVKAEFARRLSAGEISPRHIQSMDETLRKFLEKYGDTNLATVTATDIKQWLSGMNLAIKTRNRHLGYVKNALGIGKDFGLLAENPLQGAELLEPVLGRGAISSERSVQLALQSWIDFYDDSAGGSPCHACYVT